MVIIYVNFWFLTGNGAADTPAGIQPLWRSVRFAPTRLARPMKGIMRMTRVRDLLNMKGNDVWSIGPDATVFDALAEMARKEVGALAVMNDDRLVGIISERDYARKVILKGRTSRETRVREIMTEKVICTAPDQSVEACMALLTNRRIRHLPVLEDGKIVGMISIGDLVKSIISNQQHMIEQLEQYINGAP